MGVLYPAPLPVLFLGLVLGSLSALVATGLVLVYRANRIINFAQGDMGAVAAVLAALLIVGPEWNFFVAATLGFALALGLGALTEIAVIRRFAKAPRLILTVATIGLLQVFAAFQLALPQLFDYDVAPQPPLPFDLTFEWFPVVFNAGHVLIVAVVPVVVVGLTLFFNRTRIGIAVRAAAESTDRASLLGIPTKRINTLVWVIAAGLSGLGVLLRMPIQGVAIGGAALGPALLLRALAAAVIGRMESLSVTFGAALLLGMVEQAVLFETGRTIVVDAILFFVILGGLLLSRRRRRASSRAEETGASSWKAIREVRPIPRELWRLPGVRWTVRGLGVIVGAALLFVPLGMSSGNVNLLGAGVIMAMVILSLVVLTGWAGQISLGQMAFVAFGAAIAGTLAQQGRHFFVSLLVAGLVGAGVAFVVGLPALRVRGLFLAVATLAFALTTGTFFLNDEFFPALVPDQGVRILRPILFEKFDLESEHTFYYVILAAFALVVVSVRSLKNSRTGRTLVAVRDNRRSAQAFGVSPTRAQLTAFAFSGFIAALAGGIFVFHQHAVSGTVFEIESSLRIFSMAVIGGLGSVPGAVLGAGYLIFLDFSPLTETVATRLLASGIGVLFVLLLIPSGLGGLLYDVRDALLRRVAGWKDIVVPSLVADVRAPEPLVGDSEETTRPLERAGSAEPAADPLLRVSGLDVAYGRARVLFGVDFAVGRDEIVALLGTNGAGKSTLLNAIAGLVAPVGGTIVYDGEDVTRAGPNDTVSRGLVLMPGAKGVFPTLTVAENLRLAAWLYTDDPAYVRDATEEVLGFFPILRERWEEKAGDLSGGEQQMLTLGQVFIAKPRLLMIDELTLGLAPLVVEQLLRIVRAIHERGTAIVLVEQSVNVAVTLAERAVFLEKGEVRFEGATADLLDRPDILRAVFLEGAAAAGGGNGKRERGGALDLEREPFVAVCEVCGREHPVVLEVEEMAARFGGILAVRDVSFQVREGQITGIIGPNGAGKTTVFDLISGFVPAAGGRVYVCGTDVTDLVPDERATLGLGRSFQDARLFPSMTTRQAIATALERHVRVRDPLAAALVSPAVKVSEREVDREVDRLIELMHLEAYADKFVGELSTGTRRIVDLACAMAHDPKVLLLDEPSAGLAQRETEALGPLLVELRDETGAGLVVIEHDMPLVTSVSDELVALDLGAVVARGDPAEVMDHPAVVEGYLGSSEEAIRRSGRRPSKGRRRRRRAKA